MFLPAILAITMFSWFDNPLGNTGNTNQILAHRNHADATMTVRPYVEADWDAARATGQCVIVFWPREVFDLLTPGRDIPWASPVYWPVENPTVGGMIYTFYTHRDQICGIFLADEVDCGLNWMLTWTPAGCSAASDQIEWNARMVKWLMSIGYLPQVPVWVNYTAPWAAWFVGPAGLPRDPSVYGVRLPPSADVISFDAYTSFDSCFARVTCPQLWAGLHARMSSTQRFAAMPRAFVGPYLGWNPSISQIVVMAWSYYNYVVQSPAQFWAVIPFLWRGPNGAMYSPELAREYITIAQLLTGKREVAPDAVTGVRIVRGE